MISRSLYQLYTQLNKQIYLLKGFLLYLDKNTTYFTKQNKEPTNNMRVKHFILQFCKLYLNLIHETCGINLFDDTNHSTI